MPIVHVSKALKRRIGGHGCFSVWLSSDANIKTSRIFLQPYAGFYPAMNIIWVLLQSHKYQQSQKTPCSSHHSLISFATEAFLKGQQQYLTPAALLYCLMKRSISSPLWIRLKSSEGSLRIWIFIPSIVSHISSNQSAHRFFSRHGLPCFFGFKERIY